MKAQIKIPEIEERKRKLRHKRGEILGKLISEKEQRSQWLVQLMDIEDELEELSFSARQKDLRLIFQE